MDERIEDTHRFRTRFIKKCPSLHKSLLLASALLSATLHNGSSLAFSVLFEDIRSTFNTDRANTAAVGSIFFGCQFCCGFLVGVAVHRCGPRVGTLVGGVLHSLGFVISYFATSIVFLQIAYGVLGGTGNAFMMMVTNIMIPHYFQGRSAVFALTVVAFGPGLGGMCLPYLFTWLTETYTLRGAFLVLGGILMNAFPCALLWFPLNPDQKQTGNRNITDQSSNDTSRHPEPGIKDTLWRFGQNRPFVLYVAGASIVLSSATSVQTLLADIWLSNGLTSENAVFLLSLLYLVGAFSRMSSGFMKLLLPRCSILTAALLAALLTAISTVSLTFATSLAENIAAAIAFGIGHGGNFGALFVVMKHLIEWNELPIGTGVLMLLTGIQSAVLPPVYGHLREITGSYTASILYTTGSMFVGSILFLFALIIRIRQKKRLDINVVEPIALEVRISPPHLQVVPET